MSKQVKVWEMSGLEYWSVIHTGLVGRGQSSQWSVMVSSTSYHMIEASYGGMVICEQATKIHPLEGVLGMCNCTLGAQDTMITSPLQFWNTKAHSQSCCRKRQDKSNNIPMIS